MAECIGLMFVVFIVVEIYNLLSVVCNASLSSLSINQCWNWRNAQLS